MIKKERCPNCNARISSSANFCPNCGIQLKDLTKKFGLLGAPNINQRKGGFINFIGDKMVDKMLNSAIRMLQKEFTREMREMGKNPQSKIKLIINGQEIIPSVDNVDREDKNTKILPIQFTKSNLERYKKLPKKEPESTIKRLGNKIKYELKTPELKSIQDISIIRLENSLEVKAIGKNEAYVKTIPIDLTLKKYSLANGILTLEMDAE